MQNHIKTVQNSWAPASCNNTTTGKDKHSQQSNIFPHLNFFEVPWFGIFEVLSTSPFLSYKPEDSELHLSDCNVHHSERRKEGERSHQEVHAPIHFMRLLILWILTVQWTQRVSGGFSAYKSGPRMESLQ